MQTWGSCLLPLAAAVLRDQFPDGQVCPQVVASLDPQLAAARHDCWRTRRQVEEACMELTRSGPRDHCGTCRPSLTLAQVYLTFLASALLAVFARRAGHPRPASQLRPAAGGATLLRRPRALTPQPPPPAPC